jgi:hypothetical protein
MENKMKTAEELCEEWLQDTFDQSELPEHEKTRPSDLATYKVVARLGFMACHKLCEAKLKEVEKRAETLQNLLYDVCSEDLNNVCIEEKIPGSEYVLIRAYSAGVHFGVLTKREGKEVWLKDARRIWYWEGAATLSQLAVDGVTKPNLCKFSVTVPKMILTEAIEIIPCTPKAVNCILGVPEWKA